MAVMRPEAVFSGMEPLLVLNQGETLMKFDSIFFFLPSLITRPALCEKELHWNIVKETKRVECCSTFSLVEKRASADSIFRQHSNSFFFSPRKGHPLFSLC